MDKCRMTSRDLVQDNIDAIGQLFPNCLKEVQGEDGKPERGIDFEVLKQELSRSVIEGRPERYEFNWPGKRAASLTANTPIKATLRPCRKESVNFDTTENLYIEGDNLDVLKLLCDNYRGKIKMIYIDPPYNTGNDFIYEDDFAQTGEEYRSISGDYDDQGNRLTKNTTASGRFHTDWLNMMYPRLKIAQKLLSDDGVIFISIDDSEQANLKKICDEILGTQNFLAQIVWERAFSPINLMKHFSPSHDYILCYAKNIDSAVCNGIPRSEEANDRYSNPDNDPRGVWSSSDISVGPAIAEKIYPITTPSGRVVEPPAGRCWSLSKKAFFERLQDNRIWFGPDGNGTPRIKRFLSELKKTGITPMTVWKYEDVGHSQEATQKLAELFDGKKFFDYPKSVPLLVRLLSLYSDQDSLILDFFSGSATTAHAVMQLNAEDGGHRKFIMVQLPEACAEGSEAAKAGYKNICSIGKERIRRAGAKIAAENAMTAPNLDIGFRVLKLDSSNMTDVYYSPDELKQEDLFGQADNVKEGRTAEDLLFQVMLEKDIPLSSKIETEIVAGKTIFNVAGGYLLACFDKGVTDEVVTAIAKKHPVHAVFRDAGMATDSTAINFEQIFASYSPDTKRAIL